MSDLPTYSLTELLQSIENVIGETYDGAYWITAEVASAHAKGKGYWVLDLQDVDERGQKQAQTQAMVWANNVPRVIYKFQRATGHALSQGMRVKVRVQVGFHPQWGFRLTVDDIDTSWTLGEAEANNKKIRDKLAQEGIWERNRQKPSPSDFYHVAVVAPDTSAGLEDFLREADALSQAGLCRFTVINAPFEGVNARTGIPRAFAQIEAIHRQTPLDAVCVVRGGGAASGIAWLNDEAIVRAVALCSVPVLTGIGHERDQTLVDEVAHGVCGTPSKTVGHLVSVIVQNAQEAQKNWVEFNHAVHQRLQVNRQRISDQYQSVPLLLKHVLEKAHTHIESLWRESVSLGPQATLERGYALIQSPSGEVIKTKDQASSHAQVLIHFVDGTVPAHLSGDPS